MFNILLTQIRWFWENSKINFSVSDQHCEGSGIGCHQVTTQYCQQKSPSGEILNDVRNVKLSEKEFFKCTNGPTSRKSWFSHKYRFNQERLKIVLARAIHIDFMFKFPHIVFTIYDIIYRWKFQYLVIGQKNGGVRIAALAAVLKCIVKYLVNFLDI